MKNKYWIAATLVALIMLAIPLIASQETATFRIAVASDGREMESQVAVKGARARFMQFYDQEGKLMETAENPFWQQARRAGVGCALYLGKKKISIFVAGTVGPKMKDVLESEQITFMTFRGTIREAVSKALEKKKE